MNKKMTLQELYDINPEFFNKDWHGKTVDMFTNISVGPGWYHLIAKLAESAPEGTYVQQIKEKFGGLSCHVNAADNDYWKIDKEIEQLSFQTCEQCGTIDNVTNDPVDYWIKTLCEDCRQQ